MVLCELACVLLLDAGELVGVLVILRVEEDDHFGELGDLLGQLDVQCLQLGKTTGQRRQVIRRRGGGGGGGGGGGEEEEEEEEAVREADDLDMAEAGMVCCGDIKDQIEN